MSQPEKFPTLCPYITVKNLRESLAFYEKAFGFETMSHKEEENGVLIHAEMKYADAFLLFGAEGAYGSEKKAPASSGASIPLSLWLTSPDVDAQYKRAVAAGATSLMEPNDAFWGARVCMLKDIDGYEWGFCKSL